MQPDLTHREITILRPMAYPNFVLSYLFGGEREIRRRERRKGKLEEVYIKTNEAVQLEPVYLEKNHRRQIRLNFFFLVWAFPGLFFIIYFASIF